MRFNLIETVNHVIKLLELNSNYIANAYWEVEINTIEELLALKSNNEYLSISSTSTIYGHAPYTIEIHNLLFEYE